MTKDQYIEIIKRLARIENLLLVHKRIDAIGQQIGAPSLPYEPDHYCSCPPKTQDDSIFKTEEEVFGPTKKRE